MKITRSMLWWCLSYSAAPLTVMHHMLLSVLKVLDVLDLLSSSCPL